METCESCAIELETLLEARERQRVPEVAVTRQDVRGPVRWNARLEYALADWPAKLGAMSTFAAVAATFWWWTLQMPPSPVKARTSTRMAIVNAELTPRFVNYEWVNDQGRTLTGSVTVPAQSRVTVRTADRVATKPAREAQGEGLFVERTMSWGNPFPGGHTDDALRAPRKTWYFAEGAGGVYISTYILLANPNEQDARVQVHFLRESGAPLEKTYVVPARNRVTIDVGEESFEGAGKALAETHFSSVVQVVNDQPIVAERTMSWRLEEPLTARHDVGGSGRPAPATHWFLAEELSVAFDTFVLVNPNPESVSVTIRYLTNEGVGAVETRDIPAMSRTTMPMTSRPLASESILAMDVTAGRPILAERTMDWNRAAAWTRTGGSVDVTQQGTEWILAEGEVGGPAESACYILLANPGSVSADVTLTFLREQGRPPLRVTHTVPANSRVTVVASETGLERSERFGTFIKSTQPIAVERAMYTGNSGNSWGSGTNEVATRLK